RLLRPRRPAPAGRIPPTLGRGRKSVNTPRRPALGVLIALLLVAGGGVALLAQPRAEAPRPAPPPEPAEATAEQVHRVCGACHASPPPDTFPRSIWRMEVKQAYDFLHNDPGRHLEFPPLESVVRYYERRAPEAFPPLAPAAGTAGRSPVRFERRGLPMPDA